MYEKEQRLRVMMKMHGLSSNTYWRVTAPATKHEGLLTDSVGSHACTAPRRYPDQHLALSIPCRIVMYLWWALVWFVYCLAMMAFGSAIGLNFFRKTSYSLQILFYLTAVHAMVGQGFLMSSLFQSSRTGLSAAYLWVLLCGVVAGNIMQTFIDGRRSFVPVLELIPSFGVYRVLYEMSAFAFRGQYRGQSGLGWGDMHDPNMGVPRVLGVFVAEFVVLTALAWYLEQARADTHGTHAPSGEHATCALLWGPAGTMPCNSVPSGAMLLLFTSSYAGAGQLGRGAAPLALLPGAPGTVPGVQAGPHACAPQRECLQIRGGGPGGESRGRHRTCGARHAPCHRRGPAEGLPGGGGPSGEGGCEAPVPGRPPGRSGRPCRAQRGG